MKLEMKMRRATWMAVLIIAVVVVLGGVLSLWQSTGVNRDNPTPVSGTAD